MDNETQFSSLVESEAEPRPFKKEGWPEFPFNHWQNIKKWNMSSLQDIAGHLAEKTEGRRQRSGFLGQPSEMERQLIEHLGSVEQQVFVLTDVVQASLRCGQGGVCQVGDGRKICAGGLAQEKLPLHPLTLRASSPTPCPRNKRVKSRCVE